MVPKVRAALAALGLGGRRGDHRRRPRPDALARALDDPTFGTRATAARPGRVRPEDDRLPSHRQARPPARRSGGSSRDRRSAARGSSPTRWPRSASRSPRRPCRATSPSSAWPRSCAATGHVYVAPEALGPSARPPSDERLRRILADIPVTIGRSGLILVLTGQPGTATSSPRQSTSRRSTEQVGTVAGDNTLIVLFADEPALERWLDRFASAPGAGRAGERPHGGTRPMNKVVLAYSGGLDTSVAVAWLREQYGVEVVTLTVDVGGGSIREGVERRARCRPGPRRRTSSTRRRRSSASSSGAPSRPTRSTRAPTRWRRRSPGR